eukprot:6175931-Pleurochrysis_carterae.AAC.4
MSIEETMQSAFPHLFPITAQNDSSLASVLMTILSRFLSSRPSDEFCDCCVLMMLALLHRATCYGDLWATVPPRYFNAYDRNPFNGDFTVRFLLHRLRQKFNVPM